MKKKKKKKTRKKKTKKKIREKIRKKIQKIKLKKRKIENLKQVNIAGKEREKQIEEEQIRLKEDEISFVFWADFFVY